MSALLRQPARLMRPLKHAASRSIANSAVLRKDLVQDLYVSELKAYKAPAPTKDAHVGSVKVYSAPTVPSAPAVPTNLASELSVYDASEPTFTSTAPEATAASNDLGGTDAQAFLTFLEADFPKVDHHHH